MNFPRWLLPTIALLAAPLVHADIIFIDLNLSSQEVAAARAAAKQRGEKLIVIPDLSPELRAERSKILSHLRPLGRAIEAEIEALYNKENAINVKAKNGTKEEKLIAQRATDAIEKQIDKKSGQIDTLYQTLEAFRQRHKKDFLIDIPSALNDVLLKCKNEKRVISSMIISGHHVFDFFGEVGNHNLSRRDIVTTLDKYPEIEDQISSLYLWGCYSNTTDETKRWKTALPKLTLIAGFDHSAPSEDKAIDENFLKGILVKEKNATAEMDEKKLGALFNSIPNIKMSSATLTCGDYYATNNGVTKISKIECSPEEIQVLQADAKVFHQYLTAETDKYTDEYKDVPINTQTSNLRTFYSRLRQMSHCPELADLAAETGRILHLIFSKNIIKNFNDYFKSDINQLNTSLKDVQPPGGSFPDLSDPKLTRAELLKKIAAFSAYWAQPAVAAAPAFANAKKLALTAQGILKNMDCIGSFWIEYPEDQQRLTADLDRSCLSRGGEN